MEQAAPFIFYYRTYIVKIYVFLFLLLWYNLIVIGDIMKVLLYFEKQKQIKQSGIGRALSHQKKALELANVDYTLDPKEEFDFAHVNT